jgi:23S rRNA (cytosine1962-C5)-methyltransferase
MQDSIKILTPPANPTYRLIDSGNGQRCEQFGTNIIIRPDSTCLWQPQQAPSVWQQAAAIYRKVNVQKPAGKPAKPGSKSSNNATEPTAKWFVNSKFKEPWVFSYHLPQGTVHRKRSISCQLRLSPSKNIGIFPEQQANWAWMVERIDSVKSSPNILNLFGYSGAATLCAAAAGAQVCHVDASSAAITAARQNQILSHLGDAPIRWITDDCTTFVKREIKRGVVYDAIIMDPPAFGRDPKGKPFAFEKHVCDLLELTTKVLRPDPLFFIFNGYALGHSASVLKNMLIDFFPDQDIEFGELQLKQEGSNRLLPCSLFARF